MKIVFLSDTHGKHNEIRGLARADILITHCPPLGILDKSVWGANMGNEELCKRVKAIKPQYHFGHYGLRRSPVSNWYISWVPTKNSTS